MDLVLGQPPVGLRRPFLIAGFGGWGDAGSAASIALRDLLGEDPPSASAMIDPSACFDFTVARPLSVRTRDSRRWSLEYPKMAFYAVPLPEAERDLLILLGPEPHFRWPQLAPAIIAYAQRAGIESVLTLGSYVGPVTHHSAPISSRSLDNPTNDRLRFLGYKDSGYEGPTSFATVLLHSAAAVGLGAASLWVATPPYLQAGNPVAALALLDAAKRVLELPLDTKRLRSVADSFLQDVDTALQEHPELAEQLREMLEDAEEDEPDSDLEEAWESAGHAGEPDPDRPPPDAPPGLPTGKALVDAVERYLRQAQREDDDGPSSSGQA